MQIDETVYHEYANWKLENEDLIKRLSSDSENIYFRFKHILDVIEFYYDKLIDDKNFSEEDDVIFKTGFYYVADQLEEVSQILKEVYDNDIKELSKHSKDINLLFNIFDFQLEVINKEINEEQDFVDLLKYDEKIYEYINNKEDVPQNLFDDFDDLSQRVFQKMNTNFYSVNNIFLEIADELNIL